MSKRVALIVGNSIYEDEQLAALDAPEQDIEGLANVLRNPNVGQFHVVRTLLNECVADVQREISILFSNRRRDDLILLYFSGHGVKDIQGDLYLALRDTSYIHNPDGSATLIRGTAIPSSFIAREMDDCFSKRQVLLLDCCNSGAFAPGTKSTLGTSMGTLSAFKGQGFGRAILTASDATQYAWEGGRIVGGIDKSLFTHFIVEGLRTGEADKDEDGRIAIDELYDYVLEKVRGVTTKQSPQISLVANQGEIIVAKSNRKKRAELPADLMDAVADPRLYVRKAATKELGRLLDDEEFKDAARDALLKLTADDSRSISGLATALLAQDKLMEFPEQNQIGHAQPARAPQPLIAPAGPKVEPAVDVAENDDGSALSLQDRLRQEAEELQRKERHWIAGRIERRQRMQKFYDIPLTLGLTLACTMLLAILPGDVQESVFIAGMVITALIGPLFLVSFHPETGISAGSPRPREPAKPGESALGTAAGARFGGSKAVDQGPAARRHTPLLRQAAACL